MAQHIPIGYFTQKIFREIENSIIKDFRDLTRVKGSLKYERMTEEYSEYPGEEVYLTNRHIPEGFGCGQLKGSFEVHYSPAEKRVNVIYFVA